MYKLNLNRPYGLFQITDFERNKRIKDELEKTKDFEQRLIYFNENVQSISIYSHKTQIYFEWDIDKPTIKIFCNCEKCEVEKEFDEQERIFFKLRTKEVKRIVKELEKEPIYKDKLQFIFSVKGYYPNRVPAIYPNMAKTEPLYLAKAIIDLNPKNEAERTIYNEFVIAEFNKIAKDENGFTKQYYGFDFEKEKQRLNETLNNGFDRERLLKYIKDKIEKAFNYPDCINVEEKEKNKHIIKDINKNIDNRTICRNIFAKLMLGIPIDINRIVLDTRDYKDYIHYKEIFKFYRYVSVLIEKPGANTKNENDTSQKIIFTTNDNMIHEILDTPRMKNVFAISRFKSETDEDFEIIYQRELKLFNGKDGTDFRQWLTKKVSDLLANEQSLPADESQHFGWSQNICTKFLKWMDNRGKENTTKEKYTAKFYALYHWLKIDMGIEKQFPKNENDQFIRSEIEEYAKIKYPKCSEQGFYRSFKELDITNTAAIAKEFGKGYKEKLISISNNDNKVITKLKNYPN